MGREVNMATYIKTYDYKMPLYAPDETAVGRNIPTTKERCTVYVELKTQDIPNDWVSLQDFMTATQEECARHIPAEHLDSAEISIEATSGYDGERGEVECHIRWSRPETDEEYNWRQNYVRRALEHQAKEQSRAATAKEEAERAQYEALKRKYG